MITATPKIITISKETVISSGETILSIELLQRITPMMQMMNEMINAETYSNLA